MDFAPTGLWCFSNIELTVESSEHYSILEASVRPSVSELKQKASNTPVNLHQST